jgi:hypothetical protein
MKWIIDNNTHLKRHYFSFPRGPNSATVEGSAQINCRRTFMRLLLQLYEAVNANVRGRISDERKSICEIIMGMKNEDENNKCAEIFRCLSMNLQVKWLQID